MADLVYCTVSLPEQANEAIARLERLGLRPDEVVVTTEVSDVERLIHTESEANRSTLIGVGYGALVGLLLGIGQMAYIGSGIWSMWGAVGIPIISACCWALVGSIVGCGGILASKRVSSEVEHRFEKEVSDSKLMVAAPFHSKLELRKIHAMLSEVGATNIHYSGEVA